MTPPKGSAPDKPGVPERHPKGWGEELWIANTPLYCGKKLILKKGGRCSVHFHKVKDETFYIQRGRVQIDIYEKGYPGTPTRHTMLPGDTLTVRPLTPHQFYGLEDSEIFEFSTEHMEEDSHRLLKGDPVAGTVQSLAAHLPDFSSKHILVVGDVMLDVFVRGGVERISPEAPVPVVLQATKSSHLGGAGNTANNVAALGAHATILGVVGNDAEGKEVARLARAAGIAPQLAIDPKRPTTAKIRVAARHQQLLRVDSETTAPLSSSAERKLLLLIAKLPKPDLVIVSDYAKGVITERVMGALKKRFGARRILADFKPSNAPLFKGVLAIKPNVKEAHELCGLWANTDAQAAKVVQLLAKRFNTSVVLTRGEGGVTVSTPGKGRPSHILSDAREIFDVTGAGDTVIAVLALMLACGVGVQEAARAANYVAGIAVGREGTTAVSAKELTTLFALF